MKPVRIGLSLILLYWVCSSALWADETPVGFGGYNINFGSARLPDGVDVSEIVVRPTGSAY